jgi:hypothetical protein
VKDWNYVPTDFKNLPDPKKFKTVSSRWKQYRYLQPVPGRATPRLKNMNGEPRSKSSTCTKMFFKWTKKAIEN